MKVIQVKISDLKPAEYNPRALDKKEAKDLKTSLEKFGMVEPIVVNKAKGRMNVIIGGHQRYNIWKELGNETMPVVYVDIPGIEQEQELNLRLNKNLGHWDWDMLANFDEDMLKDVGFTSDEIDKIFTHIEDDLLDENVGDIVSKKGEIYLLGEHRLMCGYSTMIDDLKELMGKEKADMVYTDPPFNIGIKYNAYKDDKKQKDFYDFIYSLISNSYIVAKKDAAIYFWCDEKYISMIQDIYQKLEIGVKRVCLWIKENFNPTPQIGFNKVYEACILGWKGKLFVNDVIKVWDEILNMEIDLPAYYNIWYEARDNTSEYEHPTQKPISLHEKPLKINSERGDIILDLCGGSGSTLLACEQLNRKCYIMEIDPYYCDVIRKRYARFIGKGEQWQKVTKSTL